MIGAMRRPSLVAAYGGDGHCMGRADERGGRMLYLVCPRTISQTAMMTAAANMTTTPSTAPSSIGLNIANTMRVGFAGRTVVLHERTRRPAGGVQSVAASRGARRSAPRQSRRIDAASSALYTCPATVPFYASRVRVYSGAYQRFYRIDRVMPLRGRLISVLWVERGYPQSGA